jgi:hypothetical protein
MKKAEVRAELPIMVNSALGLGIALICVLIVSTDAAGGTDGDYQGLLNLATHDFDAMPEGDHVIVKLDSAVYQLIPNKDKPGLADIIIMN